MKNTFLLEGEKLSQVGVSEKWRKKWFPQVEKLFSLAGISFPQQEYALKNGFRLISITVSTSRKKSLKSVSISWNRVTF